MAKNKKQNKSSDIRCRITREMRERFDRVLEASVDHNEAQLFRLALEEFLQRREGGDQDSEKKRVSPNPPVPPSARDSTPSKLRKAQ